MMISREHCVALDRADPLAACRSRFHLNPGEIYMDGNSLGMLPVGVAEKVAATVTTEWGRGLIRSWNTAGWFEAPARVGARLAPMIGAKPHEVMITDTISINLFKLLMAACRMRPGRRTILAESGNFPSDTYIVSSVAEILGLKVKLVPASDIAAAIDADTAVATLSHVNYKTALVQDMAAVTATAHAQGALIVWDLAHSTGALVVDLNGAKADFAVGCGYKFLNGGPGAPSHVFCAERHHGHLDQPLTGWFAHAKPFAFDEGFARAPGMAGMLCSTPQMLSLAAFEAALAAFDGVSMAELERKSKALGDLMIALFDERLEHLGCRLAAPRHVERRGCHVSIGHEEGYAIMQALIARGIVGDFRAPDLMRFGFAPLYIGYADVFDTVAATEEIIVSRAFDTPAFRQRAAVT
jgi:kynureninase